LSKNANDNTYTANSKSTSGGFTDTAGLKNSIRDGISVTLEHRDQHIGQENLCYRANTCRQSEVGQNTIGNDNHVTGFADQNDNPPQTPTPTVIPTPPPTPIPGGCPESTIFDVTLQTRLGILLTGIVLCLKACGLNEGIIAIVPGQETVTATVTIVPSVNGQCPTGNVAAAFTSGVLKSTIRHNCMCLFRILT
jgi:hypothetical protein